MTERNLEILSEFVTESSIPADVVDQAKRVFLDVLGANMRASEEQEIKNLIDKLAVRSGSPEATLLRPPFQKLDVMSAALANGTQAPAVELDDGYRFATAHSGAYVMPGTLALSESLNALGSEMIAAFAIGYEVASRAASAVKAAKFSIMGHGVFSVLGTSAAAARLKEFNRRQTRETLTMAASLAHTAHYGVLPSGATIRNYWTGAGARDGIQLTELVEHGFVGDPQAFERAYSLLAPFEWEPMISGLGDTWAISHNYHKQYACNGNFDASIEATLALIKENQLKAEEIDDIHVEIYAPYHTLSVARPRNPLAAKFSLRYAVASAAVHGHANHEAFTPSAISNPRVQRVSDRTHLSEDSALAADLPLVRPARVTMNLKDGKTVSKFVENPRGHFENPFSESELWAKFKTLVTRYVTEDAADNLRAYVSNMDQEGRVGELTDLLRNGIREGATSNE